MQGNVQKRLSSAIFRIQEPVAVAVERLQQKNPRLAHRAWGRKRKAASGAATLLGTVPSV